jgi:hypothetical protein
MWQTRVMRVQFLPPMLFVDAYERRFEQLTTGYAIAIDPGRRPSRSAQGGRAVGQRQGHLIWVEGNGSSSLPSSTRRPQHAQLPAERAPQTVGAGRTPESKNVPCAGNSQYIRRRALRTPVVQLERTPAYEAGGCRFESCRACCVRSGSGRCTGMWPRRKRVRVPPDTPAPRTTPYCARHHALRVLHTARARRVQYAVRGRAALAQLARTVEWGRLA